MTVAVETPSVDYAENGVTLAFPISFSYALASDVRVYRTVAGTEFELAYGTGYSVAGGMLTLVATVAGATLSIRRATSRAQTADYTATGPFTAESHEAALDRLARVDQELDVEVGRALRVPRGSAPVVFDPAGLDEGDLLAWRGGKLQRFDAAAFAGQLYGGAAGSGRPVPVTINDPAGANTLVSLALATGAGLVGHKPDIAPTFAIVKSLRDLLNEGDVSLSHFFTFVADEAAATQAIGQANADNWAAVGAALQALDFTEKRLKLPPGVLPMSKWDFHTVGGGALNTPLRRIVLDLEGTVQLIGTDGTKRCIFGSTQYEDFPPAGGDPLFIRGIGVRGGMMIIAPKAGESYRHAMQLDAFVSGDFERVSISGEYAAALDGHRKAVAMDIAFLNRFTLCDFGSPGAAPAAKNSYNFWMGFNNVNANKFELCRFSGAYKPGFGPLDAEQRPDDRRVGAHVTSAVNKFEQCDMSVLDIAVEANAATALSYEDCYEELVNTVLSATVGNSKAPFIKGGIHEIATTGTAIRASSAEGLVVVGGVWKKVSGATGTTFLDMGAALYGRTLIGIGIVPGQEFDTWQAGTERAHGSQGSRVVEAVQTSRAMFPSIPVPSTDPNTLDDYAEDDAPLPVNAQVALSANSFSFTKTGRMVLCEYAFTYPATADVNPAIVTGIPARFAAHANSKARDARGEASQSVEVSGQALLIVDSASGATISNAAASGKTYRGSITYRAAA